MKVDVRDLLVAVALYLVMVAVTGRTGIEPPGVPAYWWRRPARVPEPARQPQARRVSHERGGTNMARQQARAEHFRQQFNMVRSPHGEAVTLRYQHILLPRRLRRQAARFGAAGRLAGYIKQGRYDG